MSEVFRLLAEKDIEKFQRLLTAAYADDYSTEFVFRLPLRQWKI